MIHGNAFRSMALSFPETEQVPHFERIGFKVIRRRMFATYLEKDNSANIFLTPEEQWVYCKVDKEHIYPVPNKWGDKGVTTFELSFLSKDVVMEALQSAYNEIIQSKKRRKE